jgi:hypothetical protein
MTTVSVRYITDDVDAPVDSYVERLGFNVEMQPGTGFAMGGRGYLPYDIVTGRGGSQILLEDPSGNPIEPFQPGGA